MVYLWLVVGFPLVWGLLHYGYDLVRDRKFIR